MHKANYVLAAALALEPLPGAWLDQDFLTKLSPSRNPKLLPGARTNAAGVKEVPEASWNRVIHYGRDLFDTPRRYFLSELSTSRCAAMPRGKPSRGVACVGLDHEKGSPFRAALCSQASP